MAYASIPHLLAHHAGRATYTASSKPTASQAIMLIEEAAGQLNFALTQGGYDSPLLSSVGSSVKAFFQRANAMGALCMIESSAPQGHNRNDFCAEFKQALKMIATGELPGLDRDDAQSLPRFGFLDASPPFFTRDMNL